MLNFDFQVNPLIGMVVNNAIRIQRGVLAFGYGALNLYIMSFLKATRGAGDTYYYPYLSSIHP